MKKILFLTGTSFILLYVVFILGLAFYPAPFNFTESVICPPGMMIDEETVKRNFSRKNSYVKCRNQEGEVVDVTGRMLLTGLVPLSIGLLFMLFSFRGKPLPKQETDYHPNVIRILSGKRDK
jgi:hypothetical protein